MTRYEIKAANGDLLAVHERHDGPEGKAFMWRRPDGQAGLDGLKPAALPLYGTHEVTQRPAPPAWVVIVEGEKARDALAERGTPVVGTYGATTIPTPEVIRELLRLLAPDATVHLWPDNDPPGDSAMRAIDSLLRAEGREPLWIRWAGAPPGGDAADFLGTNADLEDLILRATPLENKLSALTRELLTDVETALRRHVAAGDHEITAATLWALGSWVAGASDTAAYLHVKSPLPESGKTRLFEVLRAVAYEAEFAADCTPAALKRIAHGHTLLMDEIDRTFARDKEFVAAITAIFNAGWRRGGTALVVGSKDYKVERLQVYGFKAFAGIGSRLPDTVISRSIPITMRRRTRAEHVDPFYTRTAAKLRSDLKPRLEEWAQAVGIILVDTEPALPEALSDRQQDNWRLLLAIADVAGGGWPERTRRAAVALHTGHNRELADGERILAAIRQVFTDHGTPEEMSTFDIIRGMVETDEGPWSRWWGRGIEAGPSSAEFRKAAADLARHLRAFTEATPEGPEPIKAEQLWIAGAKVRGYRREQLEPHWERNLPSQGVGVGRSVEPASVLAETPTEWVPAEGGSVGLESASGLGSTDLPTQTPQNTLTVRPSRGRYAGWIIRAPRGWSVASPPDQVRAAIRAALAEGS